MKIRLGTDGMLHVFIERAGLSDGLDNQYYENKDDDRNNLEHDKFCTYIKEAEQELYLGCAKGLIKFSLIIEFI